MALLTTNLTEVATPAAYDTMIARQTQLATGMQSVIAKYHLPWSETQLGARSEFQFCVHSPKNGSEAERAMNDELERVMHLYLLNRGIMITPFHNMTLVPCYDQSPHRTLFRRI